MIPIICVCLPFLHRIKDLREHVLPNVAFLTLHLIRSLEHEVKLIDRLIHPEGPERTAQTGFSLKRTHRLGGRGMNQTKTTNVVPVVRYNSDLKWNPIS